MVSPKSRTAKLNERIARTRRHRQWATRNNNGEESESSNGTSETQETTSSSSATGNDRDRVKANVAKVADRRSITAATYGANKSMMASTKETLTQRRQRLMNRRNVVASPNLPQSRSHDHLDVIKTQSAPANAISPGSSYSDQDSFFEQQRQQAPPPPPPPPPKKEPVATEPAEEMHESIEMVVEEVSTPENAAEVSILEEGTVVSSDAVVVEVPAPHASLNSYNYKENNAAIEPSSEEQSSLVIQREQPECATGAQPQTSRPQPSWREREVVQSEPVQSPQPSWKSQQEGRSGSKVSVPPWIKKEETETVEQTSSSTWNSTELQNPSTSRQMEGSVRAPSRNKLSVPPWMKKGNVDANVSEALPTASPETQEIEEQELAQPATSINKVSMPPWMKKHANATSASQNQSWISPQPRRYSTSSQKDDEVRVASSNKVSVPPWIKKRDADTNSQTPSLGSPESQDQPGDVDEPVRVSKGRKVSMPPWMKKQANTTVSPTPSLNSPEPRNLSTPSPQHDPERAASTNRSGGGRVVAAWQNALKKTASEPDSPSEKKDADSETSESPALSQKPSWDSRRVSSPWQTAPRTGFLDRSQKSDPEETPDSSATSRKATWEKNTGRSTGVVASWQNAQLKKTAPWQNRNAVVQSESYPDPEPADIPSDNSEENDNEREMEPGPEPAATSQVPPWKRTSSYAGQSKYVPPAATDEKPTVPWQKKLKPVQSNDHGPPQGNKPLAPWQKRQFGDQSAQSSAPSTGPSLKPWQKKSMDEQSADGEETSEPQATKSPDGKVEEASKAEQMISNTSHPSSSLPAGKRLAPWEKGAQKEAPQQQPTVARYPPWKRPTPSEGAPPVATPTVTRGRLAPWQQRRGEVTNNTTTPLEVARESPVTELPMSPSDEVQEINKPAPPKSMGVRGRLASWEKSHGSSTPSPAPMRAPSPLRRAPWEKKPEADSKSSSGDLASSLTTQPLELKKQTPSGTPSWVKRSEGIGSGESKVTKSWRPPTQQTSKGRPSWAKTPELEMEDVVPDPELELQDSENEEADPTVTSTSLRKSLSGETESKTVVSQSSASRWKPPTRSFSTPSPVQNGRGNSFSTPNGSRQSSWVKTPGFGGSGVHEVPKSWPKRSPNVNEIEGDQGAPKDAVSLLSDENEAFEPETETKLETIEQRAPKKIAGRVEHPPWMRSSSVMTSNSWIRKAQTGADTEVSVPESEPSQTVDTPIAQENEEAIEANKVGIETPSVTESQSIGGAVIETPRSVSVANIKAALGAKPAAPPAPGTVPPATALRQTGDRSWMSGNRKGHSPRLSLPSTAVHPIDTTIQPKENSPRVSAPSPGSVAPNAKEEEPQASQQLPSESPKKVTASCKPWHRGRNLPPTHSRHQPSWVKQSNSLDPSPLPADDSFPISIGGSATEDSDAAADRDFFVKDSLDAKEQAREQPLAVTTPPHSKTLTAPRTPLTGDSGKSLAALAADTFFVSEQEDLAKRERLDSDDDESSCAGYRTSTPNQMDLPTEFRDIVSGPADPSQRDRGTFAIQNTSKDASPLVQGNDNRKDARGIPRLSPSRKDTDTFTRRNRSSPPESKSSAVTMSRQLSYDFSPSNSANGSPPRTPAQPSPPREVIPNAFQSGPSLVEPIGGPSTKTSWPAQSPDAVESLMEDSPNKMNSAEQSHRAKEWRSEKDSRPGDAMTESMPRTPSRDPHPASAFTPKRQSPSILRLKASPPPTVGSSKSVRFGETPKRHEDPPEILDIESDDDEESGIVFGDPSTFGAAGGDENYRSPSVCERSQAIEGWKGGRGRKQVKSSPSSPPVKGNSHVLQYWSGANQSDREDYKNAEQWAHLDPDDFAGVREDSPSPEAVNSEAAIFEPWEAAEAATNSAVAEAPSHEEAPAPAPTPAPVEEIGTQSSQSPPKKNSRVFDPFLDDDESIVFHDNESSFFSATSATEERNVDTSPFRVILPPPRKNSASRERRQREASRDYDEYYARHVISPPAGRRSRTEKRTVKQTEQPIDNYHQGGFYDDKLEI